MRPYRRGSTVALRAYQTLEKKPTISAQISQDWYLAALVPQTLPYSCSGSAGESDLAGFTNTRYSCVRLARETSHAGGPTIACRVVFRAFAELWNSRRVDVLSAVMNVEPSGAMETEAFIGMHSDKPLANGLSAMRDLLLTALHPSHRARRAGRRYRSECKARGVAKGDCRFGCSF